MAQINSYLLEVKDLTVHYGNILAVDGIALGVRKGEIVTLIGANGAGKSTVLKGILGIQRASRGTISFMGREISRAATDKIVASGIAIVPQPILHTLNQVFREAKADWDISLTKQSGDAERFARQAAESGADVVAAYGGDGTVMDVARGLVGSPVPMAILPGGTANLMSVELGIPKDLKKAAEIACSESSQVRRVDAGKVGDTFFLLRVGLGFAARKVERADRKLKDKYGVLAYSIGAMNALTQSRPKKFKLELDGKRYEVEGLTCLVERRTMALPARRRRSRARP